MPEWLELTQDFQNARSAFFEGYDKLSSSQQRKSYLLSKETELYLYLLYEINFDSKYAKIKTILSNDPEYRKDTRRFYESLNSDFQEAFTVGDYVRAAGFVDALKTIGLDVHGGITRMCFLRRYALDCGGFPTVSLIVNDAKKARQYINIGVHLGSDIKLDATGSSSTVDQAAENHASLLELIVYYSSAESWADMKTAIVVDIVGGNAEDVIWEYKRAKFRVKIVRKSRKILIDKAVEDKASISARISQMHSLTKLPDLREERIQTRQKLTTKTTTRTITTDLE